LARQHRRRFTPLTHPIQEESMFRTFAVTMAALAVFGAAKPVRAQSTAPAKPAAQAHKTASATASSTTKASVTDTTHHAMWTKSQIEDAQKGLAKAGYYKGKPSGQMNADTRKALKAYEKANGMPATGRLSDSVLVKLKSA
jgi:peptidoglycan hydrolase-like protein with peptidoglycan-binding domain